jgi:guanine deaminase
MSALPQAFRASILHFLSDPGAADDPRATQYFDDGLLVVADGRVLAVGDATDLLPTLPAGTPATDCRPALILPGFVDAHIHYPQTDVIASFGTQLLDWLEQYTFPAERRFGDAAHARAVCEFFLDELLRNGTTTALVFGTVHRQSIDVFFEAAEARGMRMIAGKVLMDRHCPEDLRDTPAGGVRESAELIERWHGRARLGYAITPRFAITSSDEQLRLAGELARAHPTVHVHTHVAENMHEVAWARRLFPWSRSYLDIYDRFGLVRERSVFAHCIHLDADDRRRMGESGATAAFCPTSNLFLGSGLFDIEAMDLAGIHIGVATDVGGGTSFSMLRTLADGYKVAQLRGHALGAARAFYLATLGGARALRLDREIGNFLPGKEADFVVLDLAATALLERRTSLARTLAEKLFALMTLGDDRCVRQTYVLGRPAISGRKSNAAIPTSIDAPNTSALS